MTGVFDFDIITLMRNQTTEEREKEKFEEGYNIGFGAGMAMNSQTEMKIRQDERKKIINLLRERLDYGDTSMDGFPTS